MKKIWCALAALVILVSGCGARGEGLIGRWETTLDMAEYMRAAMTADAADKLTLGEADFTLVYEFDADGGYTFSVDEASAARACQAIQTAIRQMLTDTYERLIRESGSTLTVDEYLAGIGSSLDAQVDAAFGEDTIRTLTENMTASGRYRLDGEKLYCSFDADTPAEEGKAIAVTLAEDTLTVGIGEDAPYPLTFTRK